MEVVGFSRVEGKSEYDAQYLFVKFIRTGKVLLPGEESPVYKIFMRMMKRFEEDLITVCKKKKTTGLIEDLEDDQVFVFGSNLSGRHGKGAAKQAMKWGAVYGKGEGEYGRTYAIPTKSANVKRTLSVNAIAEHVKKFLDHASDNPYKTYLVTEIGCGLAGLKPGEMGPLFSRAILMDNVKLPKRFWKAIEVEVQKNFKKLMG